MPDLLLLILFSLLLSAVVMTLVWWRQLYTRNAGIVDAWWSYIFGLIAVVYFALGSGDPMRKGLMTGVVVVWSFRLGSHLMMRNRGHEDIRYKKLREEYGTSENFYMWRFFMYQAISNVILSAPFLIMSVDGSPLLTSLFWIGLGIAMTSVFGESLADEQLKSFKKNPGNDGKVCNEGLWKYSRHPNYFFEWLVWVGFGLMALESPYGAVGLLSAVLIYFLLNKVTGIPMLEELAVKTKGEEYIQYQNTTSRFFPWFKKQPV